MGGVPSFQQFTKLFKYCFKVTDSCLDVLMLSDIYKFCFVCQKMADFCLSVSGELALEVIHDVYRCDICNPSLCPPCPMVKTSSTAEPVTKARPLSLDHLTGVLLKLRAPPGFGTTGAI